MKAVREALPKALDEGAGGLRLEDFHSQPPGPPQPPSPLYPETRRSEAIAFFVK
jgi:hypothetical protein